MDTSTKHFGLKNKSGSCWVNSAIQALFHLPDAQFRYEKSLHNPTNPLDKALYDIWTSKGEEGLTDLYNCVKTTVMPAGDSIGDTHELWEHFCDKLEYLDKLCRFKVAHKVKCNNCDYENIRRDSMIEFSISDGENITETMKNATTPEEMEDWKCEKCKNTGGTKQLLIENLPEVLVFHKLPIKRGVSYTAILGVNKQKYALSSVVCFNGGHWWVYSRDMPPGRDWVELNDSHVTINGPDFFPHSKQARLLMYSLIK
jgi:ubiquitin C-terminal hydrolase